jgi:ribonuclease Z
MSKLVILGSSYAIADPNHENAHMAVIGDTRILMIDCVGSPVVRLQKVGIELNALTDLILTHFHPDHTSAVPLLLMNMWLLGRKTPLEVYGLDYTLERVEQVMALYGWDSWPNFFPVNFHYLTEAERTPVMETGEWVIHASPVSHLIPNIGLRIEFLQSKKVMVYSSDTEPCPQVARLATGADVLIHESAGKTRGHSDASQAGEIARQARVKQLYLIHYPTGGFEDKGLLDRAQKVFGGQVALAEDLMEIDF